MFVQAFAFFNGTMGSAASHSRVEPIDYGGAFVHLRDLKKGVSLAGAMAPKKVQFSIAARDGAAYLAPIVDVCPRTSFALSSSRGGERLSESVRRLSSVAVVNGVSPFIEKSESSTAVNNGMTPYRLFGQGTCRRSIIEPTFIEPTFELAKTDKARRASQNSSRRKSSSALLLGVRHVW